MSYNQLDLVVLKNIISNKKYGLDFANENDPKIFAPEVWNFANTVVSYIRVYKELPTLRVITEKLNKGNNTKLVESIKNIWLELEKLEVNDKEYHHDLEKLKKRFAEKQLISVREALSNLQPGNIDVDKSVSELQKTIQNIKNLQSKQAFESKSIKEYLPIFVNRFNAKKNNPEADTGLMTKYSFIDYATNGLKPADFVIIAGESGFGKSLFLNNIAMQVWLQDNQKLFKNQNNWEELKSLDISQLTGGKDIIYFSLEMPYEDCFNRLLSRLSGIPSRKIENVISLTKEEYIKLRLCLDFIKNYPFDFKIVDIADACSNDLDAILADSGQNWEAIFIDYLGIMRPNEKNEDQDWLKQGIIAYEIRAIARKYKKPIFSAVQLNRKSAGKESSENIGLNRLARSATIATHATHIIQIESRINEEKYCDFLYHIIKNRKGPKGKGILVKNLACASLFDKEEEMVNDYNQDEYFKDQDDISKEMENLEL